MVINRSGAAGHQVRTSYLETEEPVEVSPGKVYELAGALRNDGDGLYGLRVTWMKGPRGERTFIAAPV